MHALRAAARSLSAPQQWTSSIFGVTRHMSFEAGGDDPLQEFRENVAQFAQTVVAPHAEEVDKTNNFPTSVNLWKEMGDFGLLGGIARPETCAVLLLLSSVPTDWIPFGTLADAGITAPEEYGGLNMGYRAHCIAMEVSPAPPPPGCLLAQRRRLAVALLPHG